MNQRATFVSVVAILGVLVSFAAESACSNNRIIIYKDGGGGKWLDGNSLSYLPGDTLVLQASQSPYAYFSMANIHGTAACPVKITNEGGEVTLLDGFNIKDSTYMVIDGTGTAGVKYGIHISRYPTPSGPSVDINGKSAHFELKNIHAEYKNYGFVIKQDPLCDSSYNYPNWTFDDFNIHDNSINNMNQEGMYLGNTAPNGIGRSITCDGVTTSPIPARLSNFNVHNNIVMHTNRAGIQFSAGNGINNNGGVNSLIQNYVYDTGNEYNIDQGWGISLGGDSAANVCGNYISHTWNHGIYLGGVGLTRVQNNYIEYSGTAENGRQAGDRVAINATSLVTLPSQFANQAYIVNNQIPGPTTSAAAILFFKGSGTYNTNYLCGNTPSTLAMSFDAGIPYTKVCPTDTSPCAGISVVSPPNSSPTPSPSPTATPNQSTPTPTPGGGSQPYNGTPMPIPGIVQAEFYNLGGQNVGYYDTTSGNSGNALRTDDVDVESSDGLTNVGWVAPGEWMRYSVNVKTTGKYDLRVRVASPYTGKSMTIKFDGKKVGTVSIPNTGGYQVWQTVVISNVSLNAGKQLMRVDAVTDGYNLDYVEVASH